MGFLGVLRVKIWKYCVLIPKRHYPAWIRVCWCIACQNRFNGLSSRSVEKFCVQRRNKKNNWVVTLAIWGKVTPRSILTKCGLWGGTVDVITCAIFRNCRLTGEGMVRGLSLPSPIDLTCRPYNRRSKSYRFLSAFHPASFNAHVLTHSTNSNWNLRGSECVTKNIGVSRKDLGVLKPQANDGWTKFVDF